MTGKRGNYICYLCGKHLKRCKGKPRPGVCSNVNDNGGRHLWIDEQQLEFQARQCIEEKGIKSMNENVLYLLGQYYATEGGSQYNSENAMLWYQKAADAGHVGAMLLLGQAYMNGVGGEQNKKQAIQWYQKAADAGHVGAMLLLGQVYMNGVDGEQDKKQAIQWYQKAAGLESHEAMMVLAHAYEEGDGVTANKSEAMNWYRKVAYETVSPPSFMIGGPMWDGFITDVMKQTDSNTSYDMVRRGYAYEYGIVGVEKDLCQAISWYKKAAEAGEHFAIRKLADAYASGKFIEKNEEIALTSYREVAEKMVCSETGYAESLSRRMWEKSVNWGEGAHPFVTCWDEIINWLNALIPKVEEDFRDIVHGAQVVGEELIGFIAIKHKLFYKENNQWFEITTTREVVESKVPAHIRDKVMEQSEEVDLTEELAPILLS